MNIEGVFPPVTTPFDNNGRIVHDHLAEILKDGMRLIFQVI